MDKYRHTVSSSLDTIVPPPNQIRVSSRKRFLSFYVKQACNLLSPSIDSTGIIESNAREAQRKLEGGQNSPKETQQQINGIVKDYSNISAGAVGYFKTVSFMGIGRAMTNAITAAELVKKKMPELHQTCVVSTMEVKDIYEPLEEGLDLLELPRQAAVLTVTLASDPNSLDKNHSGYQKPGEVLPLQLESENRPRLSGKNSRMRRRNDSPRNAQNNKKQVGVQADRKKENETEGGGKSPSSPGRRRNRGGGVGDRKNKQPGRKLDTISSSTVASRPSAPPSPTTSGPTGTKGRRPGRKSKSPDRPKRWMASEKVSSAFSAAPKVVAAQ